MKSAGSDETEVNENAGGFRHSDFSPSEAGMASSLIRRKLQSRRVKVKHFPP